ncbi:MAG: hypothetical protein ISS70_26210 [Phycisphaerae bacterium]|nr:hypothetical protein [Phycisphaerae bacterium]
MRNQKAFLLAAIVLVSSPIAGADLILTLNGYDLSDSPLIQNLGELLVAVEGTTQIGPNDVSVGAVGGVLEPVADANNEYYFEFDPNSNEATISLITNIDIVIDGNSIAAGATIYKLWLFCNRGQNILAACGMPLEDLIPPEGESGSETNDNDGTGLISTVDFDEAMTDGAAATYKPNEFDKHPVSAFFDQPAHYSPVSCPNDPGRPYGLGEFAYSAMSEANLGSPTPAGTGEGGYVELEEITSSQFLDPDVIYYVPNPPLLIHGIAGEEIDVVIPAETTIVLAEDWDYGIVVYDGANVHFGEPTAEFNEPNASYEPDDANNPVPPVWVVGESGSPFFNNFCGVLITQTAGTRCKLDNICLSGFYYGMQVDQQLDQPISNIHAFACYNGVLSFGPNRILNSSVSYYGVWSPDWPYDGRAYEFMSQSSDGSMFFEGADFEIFNCLADDGDYAFTANGLYEPNEEPILYATDCAATNSYTGFNCVNGFLGISVICPGLYNNFQNKNFPELPFTDPIYEVNEPFITDPNDYRVFLNPNSQFVNHGSVPTAFQGWTTNIDGAADEGVGDIWPHYQTNRADNYPQADLDSDHTVNWLDLDEFADQWLTADPLSGDFNNDGKINFLDYSVLANQWLLSEMSIEIFDLDTIQTIEPNNVKGYVGIELKDIPPLAEIVSVYLDNTYLGRLRLGFDDKQRWIELQSDAFVNGWHVIRIVSTDIYGNVINHRPINVFFDNLLYKVSGSDYFHPDNDYKFTGFYDRGSTLDAKVTDHNDQIIWSNTYSGPYISITIPGTTFGTKQFCELSITETGGAGGAAAASSSAVTTKDLTKKFKQSDYSDVSVRMVIVLPNKDVFRARKPAILECARACERRGVSWVPLYHHDVTENNLTFLYSKPSVRYIYWCGHANSHVKEVQRTHTECWRYEKGGWWGSEWHKIGVFSFFNLGYPLPDNWDNRGFSLWSLGMDEEWNKKIVFVDGCLSAVYTDMAYAYGVYSLQGQGSKDQIYIGWTTTVETSSERLGEFLLGDTTAGVRMFWQRLGLGDTVEEAFEYIDVYGNPQTQKSFFGLDTVFDYGEEDDNIVFYGNGFINQIELES